MASLWQILQRAAQQETLSCDDCVVILDNLADLLGSGYPSEQLLKLAERHLSLCPGCHEEHAQHLAELLMAQERRVAPNIGLHDSRPGHAQDLPE